MRLKCLPLFVACLFLFVSHSMALAGELKTKYAAVVYGKEQQMLRFSANVAGTAGAGCASVCDELGHVLDAAVLRVETVLGLVPEDLHFTILLTPSAEEVRKIYSARYGRDTDYVAFYAPEAKTIFISVADARPGILIHEITHAVLDQYFLIPPSAAVQEILAHFVELHIDN
jgi:hypothetical protein